MHHRHLPQHVREGVGNGFYVGPGRTNNYLVSVPEGLTQLWEVGGPPATSLLTEHPRHLKLREVSSDQARPGARSRTCHCWTSGPRCSSRWWHRIRWCPTQAAPGRGRWQNLPQPLRNPAPPPPAGGEHSWGMLECCAYHLGRRSILQALASGVLLIQKGPEEGVPNPPFGGDGRRSCSSNVGGLGPRGGGGREYLMGRRSHTGYAFLPFCSDGQQI